MYYRNRPLCTAAQSIRAKYQTGNVVFAKAEVLVDFCWKRSAEKYTLVPFSFLVEYVRLPTQYGITAVTVTKEPKK